MSTINTSGTIPGVRPAGATEGLERTLRRTATAQPGTPPAAKHVGDVTPSDLEVDLRAFQIVQQNLSTGSGLVSAGLGGAQSVQRLLGELRATAAEAAKPDNAPERQAALAQDFNAKLNAVRGAIDGATYNGRNLLSPGAENVSLTAALSGGQLVLESTPAVGAVPERLAAGVSDASTAEATLGAIDEQIKLVGAAIDKLGASQKSLEFQGSFLKTIADASNAGGVNSLVDADLAAEAAKIRALQLKQQLGESPLGIANQRPQSLLSLFK